MKDQENPNLFKAYLLGAFGVLVFGATLPVTRLALADFDPALITFGRALIATVLAGAVILSAGKPFRHSQDLTIFIAGLFLIFGFPGGMAIAMQTVPSAHGGVVLGFLPLATAIIASLIAEEKPSLAFWLFSLLGCSIVATYTFLKVDDVGNHGISIGDLWLIAAGLAAATGYVLFGKVSRTTPGWEVISRALILNFPITAAGLWWFWTPLEKNPSFQGVIALSYLGAFSMYLGFCAWNMALAMGGIARIGQIQLLQTFVTLIFAALLLGEVLDMWTTITAVLITAIIAITRKV